MQSCYVFCFFCLVFFLTEAAMCVSIWGVSEFILGSVALSQMLLTLSLWHVITAVPLRGRFWYARGNLPSKGREWWCWHWSGIKGLGFYRGTLWLSVDVKEGGVELLSWQGRDCTRCVYSAVSVANFNRKPKEREGAPGSAQCQIKPCPCPRVSQASAC